MSRHLRSLLVAVVATAALVGAGLALDLGDDPPEEPAAPAKTPPPVTSTPLGDYDTETVTVRRAAFCPAVAADAIERALGAAPTEATAYRDGQPAQVTGSVRDVAHEFGCGWTSGRATARGWVFAPPVTPDEAAELVATARDEAGCEPTVGGPAFGSPSVGLVCETERGLQVSFRGLFGDAWLACSVVGRFERDDAVDRAGRWCVAVAQAAAGTG